MIELDTKNINKVVRKYLIRLNKENPDLTDEQAEVYVRSLDNIEQYLIVHGMHILEAWGVIRYITLTGNLNDRKEFWKNKLCEHMTNVANMEIKYSDANRTVVEKMIKHDWIEGSEYYPGNYKTAWMIWLALSYDERVNVTEEDCIPYAIDLQNAIPEIAKQMAYGTEETIRDYIKTI